MPSITVSPAQYVITWGEVSTQPTRTVPGELRLVVSMGSVLAGPGTNLQPIEAVPQLDRLVRQEKIVDGSAPSERFQIIWENTMRAIELAFENQQGQIEDLGAIVARLEAVQEQAAAAVTIAQETQATTAITGSYTDPVNILRADSDGLIYINAHTRVYGDGLSVPVNGSSLIGFSPGDYVSVYYEDAARAGGAVDYMATVGVVPQTGATHSVGQILIPIPGDVPNIGGGVSPPGYTPQRNLLEGQ